VLEGKFITFLVVIWSLVGLQLEFVHKWGEVCIDSDFGMRHGLLVSLAIHGKALHCTRMDGWMEAHDHNGGDGGIDTGCLNYESALTADG
jgi:hypothetical protein